MQYAPTRVREKPVQFHNSTLEYVKNAPDFTFPDKDTPKNLPGFTPKPSVRIVSGRMQYASTRVHEKFGGV